MLSGSRTDPAAFDERYFAAVYPDYLAQNPPRKMRFYRQLAEQAAPRIASPVLLDVGCAFGTFLGALPVHWSRWGTDVSRHALEQASRQVAGATFAPYDGLNLPFPGPFDVITAFDVLEHVPHLDELLARLIDALVPGGALVCVVPVYDGPSGPIIRALDWDETHVHKRDRWFWLEKLGRGLRIDHWEGIYRYLLPNRYYLHFPTRRLRRWAPALAVIVRKVA